MTNQDPLDMHSDFDPEDGRCELSDESAAALAAGIRSALTEPIVDLGSFQDDNLPPLADGSRWDGGWLIEGECEYEQPTRHCLHEYGGGDWCLMSDIEQPDVPDPPTVATLVYLLARHQRTTGIERDGQSDWWADRLRALAAKLDSESEGHTVDAAANALAHAARSIRAILDDLGRKGLC